MTRYAWIWPFVLLFLVGSAAAQDRALTIGDFTTHGSITSGYRFADVTGRQQKFDELFSLRSGFRVHDFSVVSRGEQGQSFADSILVSGSGLGGDPFASTRLQMTKRGVYDLRVNYRQAYYYWDRNDDVVQPSGVSGLTSNHDFATVRRFGSADFTLDLTPALRAGVEYLRTERKGNRRVTRVLEYFDAPRYWGSFMRANPYVMEGPADEASNQVAGRVDYSANGWNLFFRAGYRRYEEQRDLRNLFSGQRSINVDDARTASELLDTARWAESRRTNAPFTEGSFSVDLHPRVRLRGGYIYYRHSGPSEIETFFDGTVRQSGTTFIPYTAAMTITGEAREPNHVIDHGLTLDLTEKVRLHSDYRYSRFTIENHVEFRSTDDAGEHSGEEGLSWEQGLHTLDVSLEISPFGSLLVRPGIRLLKRDVSLLVDGVGDQNASRRSKIVSPILSIYYTPSPRLTMRGDIRSTTNDGPYTRVTPRTDVSARWIIRYTPTDRLSMENALSIRNGDYPTTQYESRLRSNSTLVSYAVNDDVALRGGFSYDSYLATSDVEFIRGTQPREAVWRDQTISRVWQAGVEVRPTERVRLRMDGNYVRTTGVGEISGEPPTFGPLRWPMVTTAVEVDVPRAGTLALDLQRTYYIEEILTGDNFSANILGVRWILDF